MGSPIFALRPKPTRTSAKVVPRSPLEGMRVLVVDHVLKFLELAATVLRHAGAEFRAMSSSALAHDLLETWLPNVVLTDLAMPGEDGPMLASALRTSFIEQQVAVPIVALTASGTPESRGLVGRADFDLYLTKPVDPAELAEAVGAVVRGGARTSLRHRLVASFRKCTLDDGDSDEFALGDFAGLPPRRSPTVILRARAPERPCP